jgi:hypothetical protein
MYPYVKNCYANDNKLYIDIYMVNRVNNPKNKAKVNYLFCFVSFQIIISIIKFIVRV